MHKALIPAGKTYLHLCMHKALSPARTSLNRASKLLSMLVARTDSSAAASRAASALSTRLRRSDASSARSSSSATCRRHMPPTCVFPQCSVPMPPAGGICHPLAFFHHAASQCHLQEAYATHLRFSTTQRPNVTPLGLSHLCCLQLKLSHLSASPGCADI